MSPFCFRLNPPFKHLPHCSALLNGVASTYQVDRYRTALSLKSVIRGAAFYQTREGRHLVTEDSFLILNHGQEYSLEFQGPAQTETLCPFFQRGLFEHVADSLATPVDKQLDDVDAQAPATEFCERLYHKAGPVGRVLEQIRLGLGTPRLCTPWLEDRFFDLATAMAELRSGVQREIDEFPGRRAATRTELYRRLHLGRDFLSSCYDQPLTVALAAKVAHLSPFHFHRMFKSAFSQTPMQFLQERRLAAARRLLSRTDQPITSICFAIGFESLGSFSWLFRKRFGLSPSEFRARHGGPAKEQM
jgi:AraC-like DNA-binding protein